MIYLFISIYLAQNVNKLTETVDFLKDLECFSSSKIDDFSDELNKLIKIISVQNGKINFLEIKIFNLKNKFAFFKNHSNNNNFKLLVKLMNSLYPIMKI